MVAGYHYRADTGAAAFIDRRLDLRADGVDHAGKTDEAQLLLQITGGAVLRQSVPAALRRGKNAQGAVCHGVVHGENFPALFFGERQDFAVIEIVCAALEHLIGRALGILNVGIAAFMDGGHHLAHGVKRSLGGAGLRLLKLRFYLPVCRAEVHKRGLGRLALCAAGGVDRVAAERHCGGKLIDRSVMLDDGHLVLRQRAGLVGADDLSAAECFDGGQAADNGIALTHVRDADGQHDRDDRCKPLRYRGDGEGYGDHEGAQNGVEREVARDKKVKHEDENAYPKDKL